MRKKPTKAQLAKRVSDCAVDFYIEQSVARILRERLHAEYNAFFYAHGEVEPGYRRIDPSNPAYTPVIAHTADAYERYQKARQAKNNAKRRMENAIRALIGPDASPVTLPEVRRPVMSLVRRVTNSGETLQ